MAKIDLNNMEGVYFDVLREIGNIGAGNATTALATMIGTKVDMRVPKVGLMEFKEIGAEMGGEETIMAGIYQQIKGDISGDFRITGNWKYHYRLILVITFNTYKYDNRCFSSITLY